MQSYSCNNNTNNIHNRTKTMIWVRTPAYWTSCISRIYFENFFARQRHANHLFSLRISGRGSCFTGYGSRISLHVRTSTRHIPREYLRLLHFGRPSGQICRDDFQPDVKPTFDPAAVMAVTICKRLSWQHRYPFRRCFIIVNVIFGRGGVRVMLFVVILLNLSFEIWLKISPKEF